MEATKQELVKYSVTDAHLAEMKELTQLEKYDDVKHGIAKCRNTRVDVEKERKSLNEDALRHQRAVNEEAKRITASIQEVEDVLKEKKKVVDDEKEKIKQEKIAKEVKRKAAIQIKIDIIKSHEISALRCSTAKEIESVMDQLSNLAVDPSYDEFQGEAIIAHADTANKVEALFTKKILEETAAIKRESDLKAEEEKLAAEREELAKQHKADQEYIETQRIEREKLDKENREEQDRQRAEREKLQSENDELERKNREAQQKQIDAEKESQRLKDEEMSRKAKEEADRLHEESIKKSEEERKKRLEAMKPDVIACREFIENTLGGLSRHGVVLSTKEMSDYFSEVIDQSLAPLNKFMEDTQEAVNE